MCNEGGLELGEYPVPRITVDNCLKGIGSKPITYKNYFPLITRELLSQRQVKFVEDIIVTRDTAKVGIPRKGVIQVISDIGQ